MTEPAPSPPDLFTLRVDYRTEVPGYKLVLIGSGFSGGAAYLCDRCGALVGPTAVHTAWHNAQPGHAAGCPAGHDCGRDHPEADVYHPPAPCSCR